MVKVYGKPGSAGLTVWIFVIDCLSLSMLLSLVWKAVLLFFSTPILGVAQLNK